MSLYVYPWTHMQNVSMSTTYLDLLKKSPVNWLFAYAMKEVWEGDLCSCVRGQFQLALTFAAYPVHVFHELLM